MYLRGKSPCGAEGEENARFCPRAEVSKDSGDISGKKI
jgi:hypothetical protein